MCNQWEQSASPVTIDTVVEETNVEGERIRRVGTMVAFELLSRLREIGIHLTAKGDRLIISTAHDNHFRNHA